MIIRKLSKELVKPQQFHAENPLAIKKSDMNIPGFKELVHDGDQPHAPAAAEAAITTVKQVNSKVRITTTKTTKASPRTNENALTKAIAKMPNSPGS